MDGEYRQRIDIELTESEADCLLNLILSKEEMAQDNPDLDHSSMVTMLFARLVGAYPNLMDNDKAMSFLRQHGYGPHKDNDNNSDNHGEPMEVPFNILNDKALVIWDMASVRKIQQHLQATGNFIKAELTKLDSRAKYIESCHIRRVLCENAGYLTEQRRLAEIWRRLGADADYKLIKERKRSLKSELAKISTEINTLSRTTKVPSVSM